MQVPGARQQAVATGQCLGTAMHAPEADVKAVSQCSLLAQHGCIADGDPQNAQYVGPGVMGTPGPRALRLCQWCNQHALHDEGHLSLSALLCSLCGTVALLYSALPRTKCMQLSMLQRDTVGVAHYIMMAHFICSHDHALLWCLVWCT